MSLTDPDYAHLYQISTTQRNNTGGHNTNLRHCAVEQLLQQIEEVLLLEELHSFTVYLPWKK